MAISQTPDGYIWVGTANGLARFDGIEFKRFGLSDGLSSLYVRVLLADKEGGLWIGTVNGLSRYFDGRFTTWTTHNGLPGNVILGLVEDMDGTVWIATNAGLAHCRRGKMATLKDDIIAGRYIAAVTVDRDNTVWLSVNGVGLLLRDGSSFSKPSSATATPGSVSRLFCDSAGRIWAGNESHVYCFEKNTWKEYGIKEGLPEVRMTSLFESADASIWVGTVDRGLYSLRAGNFHRVAPTDLSDAAILGTIEDRDNNLWVGTRAGGLNRLKPKRLFTPSHVEDGVEISPVSLAESSEGALWVAPLGRSLYRFDLETNMYVRNPLPTMPVSLPIGAILTTRDDTFWWGSGWLASWKDGKLLTSYSDTAALRGDAVRCLLEDHTGGLWIGTRDGRLLFLQDNVFTIFTNSLPRVSLTTLVQQGDGTLWIGSYGGGIGQLKGGVTTIFDRKQGLGSDLVRALLLDSRTNLWIGTEGGGLSCFKDGVIRTFGMQHGLGDDSVVQILEDDSGGLWLGTFRGIYHFSRKQLDGLLSGRIKRVFPRKFDRSDGMLSEQCSASFGASLKTRSGLLCFSTDRGLVIIDPRQNTVLPPRPLVHVESLFLQDRAQALEPGRVLKISPRPSRFEFQYAALFFAAPERVQFRYRLGGLDKDWIEAGARRSAYYSHLPPGRYRFEVAAHNGDGHWKEADPPIELDVLPHFTETWWFRSGGWLTGVTAASAGVVWVVRRRNRRRFQEIERERILERERARIAQDLHDDLGANLTRIRFLGSLAARSNTPPADVPLYIEQMRRGALDMVIALDEIVWAVNPKNDSLRALVSYLCHYSEEFMHPTTIRCRLDMPDQVPDVELASDLRHNIFLAFKEALNNVVRHSNATEAQIELRLGVETGELLVRDDGRGFDPVESIPAGNGLENMRSRLQAVGGQFTVDSSKGRGTVVSLKFPLI